MESEKKILAKYFELGFTKWCKFHLQLLFKTLKNPSSFTIVFYITFCWLGGLVWGFVGLSSIKTHLKKTLWVFGVKKIIKSILRKIISFKYKDFWCIMHLTWKIVLEGKKFPCIAINLILLTQITMFNIIIYHIYCVACRIWLILYRHRHFMK